MAYEWMFHDANEYYSLEKPGTSGTAGKENTAFPDNTVPAKASKKSKKGIPFTPEQKERSAPS